MRFGSCKGAQKIWKSEFRFFLKSDDSALELLELLTSTRYKYSKSYSDFVLVTKIEFLKVIYIKSTYLEVVKNFRLKDILKKQFGIVKNAYF